MRSHVTPEEVLLLKKRDLPAGRVLSVLRHVGECAECRREFDLENDLGVVRGSLASDSSDFLEHPEDPDLSAWVDGSIQPAEREILETHFEDCPPCRAEVDELISRRLSLHRRPRQWAIAAAVVLAVGTAAILWTTRGAEQVVPARSIARPLMVARGPKASESPRAQYDNPEWQTLVDRALEKGTLPPPRVELSFSGTGVVRGAAVERPGIMQPAGAGIDSIRPRFQWSPVPHATYSVTVVDGDRPVASSGTLRRPEWNCDRVLTRGRTYLWQVEVARSDGTSDILPSPPAAPAAFRVLSQREHDELAAAAARYPHDPLLLAVLHARSGMGAEARQDLRSLAGQNPDSSAVRRLIQVTQTRQ